MLATLTGDLCLLVGLAVLLLPLLATELSRPRDGVWGAVVLLLGLVLVTSNDRLRGAPMLAVACGALVIGRLGSEVAQARWQQLSLDEQQRLGSRERWTSSLQQLITALASLSSSAGSVMASLKAPAQTPPVREGASRSGKRWVGPKHLQSQHHPRQSQQRDPLQSPPLQRQLKRPCSSQCHHPANPQRLTIRILLLRQAPARTDNPGCCSATCV